MVDEVLRGVTDEGEGEGELFVALEILFASEESEEVDGGEVDSGDDSSRGGEEIGLEKRSKTSDRRTSMREKEMNLPKTDNLSRRKRVGKRERIDRKRRSDRVDMKKRTKRRIFLKDGIDHSYKEESDRIIRNETSDTNRALDKGG